MSKTKRGRGSISSRPARPMSRPSRPPATPDPVRVVIDALILLVGLGIIVVRGILDHGGPIYIGSGVVFVAFALWRLRQYVNARR